MWISSGKTAGTAGSGESIFYVSDLNLASAEGSVSSPNFVRTASNRGGNSSAAQARTPSKSNAQ
jgi:hypothetical protein